MGWENVFHCEIAEFPRKVLKYHFPKSICYEDIKKTDFTKHRGKIDIISGGFPCQPYSNAGKRKGKEDDRHLWPEMLRVIREVQPRFVVGENVSGLLTWNNGMVFHEIITDLENEGYETQAFLIPACATNAPHRRDRVWFVAYTKSNGRNERGQKVDEREINKFQNRDKIWDKFTSNGKQSNVAHSNGTEQRNDIGENIAEEGEIRWGKESNVFGKLRSDGNATNTDNIRRKYALENGELERKRFGQSYQRNAWDTFPSVSPVCGGDDGISTQLDGITFSKWRNESIKGYGNAVVPQVVYRIFLAIEQSIL